MQTANCANCGQPLVTGGLFCEYCGARVEQAVPEKLKIAEGLLSPIAPGTESNGEVSSATTDNIDKEAGTPSQADINPIVAGSSALFHDDLPPAPTPAPTYSYGSSSSNYRSGSRISRRSALGGIGTIIGVGVLLCRGGLLLSRINRQSQSTYYAQTTPTPYAVTGTLYIYRGHSDVVWSVAWSPKGDTIASAGGDGTVQVWLPTTGHKVLSYKGGYGPVMTVAWSPNGKRLVSESFDELDVNDAVTGRSVYVNKEQNYALGSQIVSWSPDGKRIAFATGNVVEVVDAGTGTLLVTYGGHTDGVMAVAWSPDSQLVASGSQDKTAQIWNATTGKNILTYSGHTNNVLCVAWSPDGKRIISGSKDGTAQTWDTHSGQNIYSYTTHTDSVSAVAWSPDGKRIVTGSVDTTAKVWVVATNSEAFTYTGHLGYITSVAWSPDGTKIASSGYDKTAQVWQPQ